MGIIKGQSSRNTLPILGGGMQRPEYGTKSTSVKGGMEEKRNRPVRRFGTREPFFRLREVMRHPVVTTRESATHQIPAVGARKAGKLSDGTPAFSRYESRAVRGTKKLIGGIALISLAGIGANSLFGDSGGEQVASRPGVTDTDGSVIDQSLDTIGIYTPTINTGGSIETTILPVESATTTIATLALSTEVLKKGSDNAEAVLAMQTALLAAGCSIGPDNADGSFGTNTETGLLTFQDHAGLEADGIFGPNSQATLSSALAAGNTACGAGVTVVTVP